MTKRDSPHSSLDRGIRWRVLASREPLTDDAPLWGESKWRTMHLPDSKRSVFPLLLLLLGACGARTGLGAPDAAPPMDAALRIDSALLVDSSVPTDSGVDAPIDAAPDAPPPVDAGPRPWIFCS